jgi:lipopolysaccharide export LptBFGC system permease protein LptF
MPFAVLLGAIFAFSRMSKSNELVATRAAGISAWQFLTPSLLVAIGLGVLSMTVFSPVAAAFLSQYARLEARYVQGQASQLAVSSTGLWLRQGDVEHQSVIHALRVAEQGIHLEEVTVFSYDGLDRFAGRIDAASADLEQGRWRMTNAWISGADGLPQHHPTYDLATELTPAQIQKVSPRRTRSPSGTCPASSPTPRARASRRSGTVSIGIRCWRFRCCSRRWCSWRRVFLSGSPVSAACRNSFWRRFFRALASISWTP